MRWINGCLMVLATVTAWCPELAAQFDVVRTPTGCRCQASSRRTH